MKRRKLIIGSLILCFSVPLIETTDPFMRLLERLSEEESIPVKEFQATFEGFGGNEHWLKIGENYCDGVYLAACKNIVQIIGNQLNDLDFRDKTRQFRRQYLLECVLAKSVLPFELKNIDNNSVV